MRRQRSYKMEHYLDNAATTRTCPEALEAAARVMSEVYGNPSSTHRKGREAKHLLDECRRSVADALGAKPEELVFTSAARRAITGRCSAVPRQ